MRNDYGFKYCIWGQSVLYVYMYCVYHLLINHVILR